MSTVQAIRTVLFYLLLSASAFVWGTLSFFIAPILPFRARYRFVVQNWCRFAIWLTRVVAGIRYEVRGLENIPEKPCVILSKHQSTWETFFLS
ncbi:lysophospholipid acyltransferase family protein, partial [Pseudomonas aeruginosa]